MWGFRKMFKYEIKSCLFCFIPFSMLMSRLSGLASALASQSNVSSRENLSMSHSQRPDGSYKSCLENLTVFCVIKAGSFSLTEGFFFFLRHIDHFRRKYVFSLPQKESYGKTFWSQDVLRMVQMRVLCLYKYYFLTSIIKFTFKVGCGLLVGFPGGTSGKEPTCQCRRW